MPLVGHACDLLKALKRVRQPDTSYVFPSQDGARHAQVRMSWYAALERAQVEDFRFHDLRHCAASYLAMGGASLLDISTILGHKTLAMVQRYSHLSDEHTRVVVEKMNRQILG